MTVVDPLTRRAAFERCVNLIGFKANLTHRTGGRDEMPRKRKRKRRRKTKTLINKAADMPGAADRLSGVGCYAMV